MTDYPQNPQYVDRETIRLTGRGVWLTNGEEITHSQTCRAFAKNLGRDAEGFFIQIGKDHKRIEVEDTPYFVIRIECTPDSVILHLNDETYETLEASSLRYSPSRLICSVKKMAPAGPFEAKFLPQPYFDLLRDLEQENQQFYVRIGSAKIKL